MVSQRVLLLLAVFSLSVGRVEYVLAQNEQGDALGQFDENSMVEPFEQGYGATVGNSLRRVLLSSIEGSALVPVNVGIGGLVIDTTSSPDGLTEVGGGLSFSADWRPIIIFPTDRPRFGISPTLLMDLFWQDIAGGKQLNQQNNVKVVNNEVEQLIDGEPQFNQQVSQQAVAYRTVADGLFCFKVSPGLIMRGSINDDVNCFCRAGGAFGFMTTELHQVPYNANTYQVPAESPSANGSIVGFFVGAGIEKQWGGHICQLGIDFERHRTDFLTGSFYYESQLMFRLIWLHGVGPL